MNSQLDKSYFMIFIILITILNLTHENKHNFITKNLKEHLRNLWNEDVKYDDSNRDPEERKSINHCRNSDYKYFIIYVSGYNYDFGEQNAYEGNSVS